MKKLLILLSVLFLFGCGTTHKIIVDSNVPDANVTVNVNVTHTSEVSGEASTSGFLDILF